MNVNKFNCIICHYPFDDSIHIPRVLFDCQHTVCSLCLSKAIIDKSKTFICPKDNIIYSNIENVEQFKINQILLDDILDEKKKTEENKLTKKESKISVKTQKTSKTKLDTVSCSDTLMSSNIVLNNNSNLNIYTNNTNSNNNINSPKCYIKKTIKFNQNKKINLSDNSLMCSIHSLPLNVICVNDHKKICGQCALNDIHLDHQIIPEQKFIEYVDELVKIFQQIENNQNDNIDINEIKANIILEKIDNKIERSKNKIKKICLDLIDNINFQFRQIEKFLDLRKNEIFTKFKFINYNIINLKESANEWMEIISNKLKEANKGSIEDINLDCLKLLDGNPNKNIFNLINIGKKLNQRFDFIRETKDMIEKLNTYSQNGLNIIPNNSIIDTIMSLTKLNQGNSKQKQNILYDQNVLTTMDNRERNNIYKNMKINFNLNNKNNLETPLFKIEEDKDLINGLHLTNIGGLQEQIKNINNINGIENSLILENDQCNIISNLSNLYSGRNINNDIIYNSNNGNIYSKKKLDDFYSKEYIIDFKNINDSKTKTQTNFYTSNKTPKNIQISMKKFNNDENSPKNKISFSGSIQRFNTQFCDNLDNINFKNHIVTPLSPINKKDLFPKLIKEKICDVSFIASKKRRNSSDSLVINSNIDSLFQTKNIKDSLIKMTFSPKLKNEYNIKNYMTNIDSTNINSTQKEIRTVETYQNKKNTNYNSNSSNKTNKNKDKNRTKNKFTRCISCSGSLIKKELKDIPNVFNNKIDKKNFNSNNYSPRNIINDNISDISTITNKINKSTSNVRHINKSSCKDSTIKRNTKNNTSNILGLISNNNNKSPLCVTKEANELKEFVNIQMKNINPSFNHINMKGDGLQFLSEHFQKNKKKKFKELKLIGCNLGDEEFGLLIKNIIENEIEIGIFNSTYNHIGDNSFKYVFEMIKKIKGLKSIFLYNNLFSRGFKDKIKNYDRDNSLYNVRLFL